MTYQFEKVESCYISCACNRTPHAVDWGCNGLICYGACNSVAIYDPKAGNGGRVTDTLTGHLGRVNAVKWIKMDDTSPETELVSVSSDQCGLVWTKSGETYVVSNILKDHEGSVTVVDAIYQASSSSQPTLFIATASIDSTVKIWERQPEEGVRCVYTVPLDSGLCLSLRLVMYGAAPWILACALDDCHIHLYSELEETVRKLQILKGHEDWVTAIDFTLEDEGDLLLASGSQDSTVRLWRFHTPRITASDKLFHVEEKLLSLGSQQLAVSLESVLIGHEGRVYSIQWHPRTNDSQNQQIKLLTASLDKTVVVWSPEAQTGVWLEEARMGEVGGNTLGFYGACFSPSGDAILAHSYLGGFHLWQKHQEGWRPGVVVGGHYDAVTDLAWEPQHGRFLLSVSTDQTTRLHAPWLSSDNENNCSWHEIARPQIHGYDLVCLAMLPGFRFVSGADEKVVRAFTAPQNFLENFKRLCLQNLDNEDDSDKNLVLPTGAAVPVLGLSNKAVFQNEVDTRLEERHVKDQYDDNSYFTPQCFTEPPTEDNLLQNTLWPETSKLYGHGYEIFSLATTSDGKLLASACKATKEEHAAILLWNTSSWQKVGRLTSHQLTVTQMAFSPDDQFLLSVSRDRCWSLFQKINSDSEEYHLVAKTDKITGIHTRIIWCCAWSHDSMYFATGSREGKVVVWGKVSQDHPVLGQFGPTAEYLELPKESITSVTFAMDLVISTDEYLVALGCEAGDIRLYSWNKHIKSPWRFLSQLSGNFGHHLAVKRLSFRPVIGKTGKKSTNYYCDGSETPMTVLQLASCGLDHTLKISDVYIYFYKP